MTVDLISITPNAQETIAYCARVSNPKGQDRDEYAKLLKYCIDHGHWSVFEMANMVVEIKTTRAIAAQILRHRSFSFQEFSQRYADTNDAGRMELPYLRTQDKKNRQNSIDNLDNYSSMYWDARIDIVFKQCQELYDQMIREGIAKECARFVLPLATPTKIYMNGTIRSWIHYINLRTGNGTQKEHMDIANECKKIFTRELPVISEALSWND